jgi:hypothetical protein
MFIIETPYNDKSEHDSSSECSDSDDHDSILNELDELIEKHKEFYDIHTNAIDSLIKLSARVEVSSAKSINVSFNGVYSDLYDVLEKLHSESLKSIETDSYMTFGQNLISILENAIIS